MSDIRLTLHPAVMRQRVPIPLATDSVKAGFPSPSENYLAPEIDLNDLLIHHREATFYVRISGDSMTDAGILDGDLAVVDKALTAADGDFVIAFVNGEFTIKQFRRDKDGQRGWLVPWNNAYPRIEVGINDDFRIWGVVTHVIHSLRPL